MFPPDAASLRYSCPEALSSVHRPVARWMLAVADHAADGVFVVDERFDALDYWAHDSAIADRPWFSRPLPPRAAATPKSSLLEVRRERQLDALYHLTTTKSRMNSCISLIPNDGIRRRYPDVAEAWDPTTATCTIRLVRCSRSETCLATPSHMRSSSASFSIVASQRHRQVSRACSNLPDCWTRDIATCELKIICWKAVDV
jgi:hypothetical protein